MVGCYNGKNDGLKIMVDIWTRMYVVLVDHVIFPQKFHLKTWFFKFITRVDFRWHYLMWLILAMMVWIGL